MLNVVVMVSGGGTNLQAIIDNIESGQIRNARIAAVISNNANAYALERAKKHGIPAVCISPKDFSSRQEFNEAFLEKVEEIGPEQTALHRLLQIAVGGNDQPEVQLDLLGAGEALNGLLLNQLQELGLDMGGQLADLIQEQRAVVGQLDLADLAGGGGPGEGALLIAEQL